MRDLPLPAPAAAFRVPTAGVRPAAGTRVDTVHLQLAGLYCAACAGLIEQALRAEPGVLRADVNHAASRARVDVAADASDGSQNELPGTGTVRRLIRAVEAAGYSASPDAAVPARALRERDERASLWRLFVASFCMMQVMMYAAPAYIADPGTLSPDLLRLLQWASWVLTIPVLAFSSGPMFRDALAGLSQRRMTMDLPVVIGIAVTFVVSSGATFAPGGVFGHEVYFDSLTMFVTFLLFARWLTVKAQHRVTSALEAATARLAPEARRLDARGQVTQVPPEALRAGDRVQVLAGEPFCADGTVIDGVTRVDEALLTGESRPVARGPGDEVMSGSLNLGGPVTFAVTRVGADTRFEGVIALMRSALTQRPALLRTADRVAVPFLWGVLTMSAAAGAVWSVIDPSRAVWVAVSVLIVTCPCALSLAAPSALLAAAGALARRGILVQRIDAFEALARLDTLFVDKTGTLTEDRLTLLQTRLLPAGIRAGLDEAGVLQAAASLAAHSSHPLSRALAAMGSPPGAVGSDIVEVPGCGLEARADDGTRTRLGSRAWVDDHAAVSADAQVWFGDARGALAAFEFGESVKPDAARAVRTLQASGLHLVVLSGDEAHRVRRVADTLGIADASGGQSPEAKLARIARAQRDGHCVGMVGDGLNDAPVIARSDVSFAFAQGAAITQSNADFVLLSGRVSDVAIARDTARRAMRVLRQNIAWAVGYNAVCIPLALAGWFPPWLAGIGMAGSSIAVVLNALRAGRRSRID